MSTMTYEYRAVDRAGARRSGITEAANEVEAFRRVAAQGLTPIELRPARRRTAAAGSRLGRRGKRIRVKDLSHFTYQLGVLVSSRIPLSDGLMSIAEQERPGPLKTVASDIARRIDSGQQIADAMAEHRASFGDVYIETIRAAERSGNLSKVLEHLSETLERTHEMRSQIKGAMIYPCCVVGVLGLAVTFLLGFVVPRFARMFEQRGIDLPVFTRLLMNFGSSLQGFWWLYAAGLFAVVMAVRLAWRRPRGRTVIDAAVHRIPYIADILRGVALARFSRVLGLSLASGVGLIDALELAGRSAGRPTFQRDVERLATQVRHGGSLADVLPGCPYLTPFTRRMLAAGEQSAELPRMCSIIARHYERESSQLAKGISTVIEPVLIVGIAVVVLVVALAIFLPMWDMVRLVG